MISKWLILLGKYGVKLMGFMKLKNMLVEEIIFFLMKKSGIEEMDNEAFILMKDTFNLYDIDELYRLANA